MKLIGLAGHGGVGKDTVAEILSADHGFIRFSFSDDLYPEVAEAFGVSIGWLQDRAVKDSPQSAMALANCKDERFVKCALEARYASGDLRHRLGDHLTPRQVLQWWGTEYRRAEDPDYWVRKATAFVARVRQQRHNPRLVNTSVRFVNEASMIHNVLGGEVWMIERDVPRPNGHVAEAGVPAYLVDRFIANNGTIEELRTLVRDVMWGR